MKQLFRKLGLSAAQPCSLDPASLGDPVALKTEWSPAASGGASFRTRHLVAVDPSRLEFRATLGALLFYFLFVLIGAAALLFAFLQAGEAGGIRFELEHVLPLIVGLALGGAGAGMMIFGTAPVVFDRNQHLMWRGREAPDDAASSPNAARFEQIHALQILVERVSTKNGSFPSYELNVVLRDGRRINVLDHGNQAAVRADAKTLAEFLARPVWDVS